MAGISGLDDLLAQFKDQARETIRAEFRAETESLRSENTLLHDTIHEKDLLYQDVVRERDELAQEVQSGKLEIKELKGRLKGESSLRGRRVSDVRRRSESFESGVDRKAPVVGGQEDLDDMHEVVQQSIETQDGPAARGVTFPSFKILEQPGTKFYRDMFDESTFKDEGAALRKASLAFKPSKLQAQILRPHIWRTSLIEEQSEAMLGAKEHGPIDSMSPSGQDVAQFETLYKGSDRQRFYHEQKELERRGQPVDRRLVPSTLNTRKRLGEHMDAEDLERALDSRRIVCIRCWRTNEVCDRGAQCKPCQRDGVMCKHNLCSHGLSCRHVRCAKLHPGQWDEKNEDWVLTEEEMNSRTKGIDTGVRNPSARTFVDSWRPRNGHDVRR